MKRTLATIISLAVAVAACGGGSDTTGVTRVSPADASSVIAAAPAGLTILDIRTPEEVAQGTIRDSINLDFYAADFESSLEGLDRNAPYVLFCRSGNRSASAASVMRKLGFTEVYEIDGGIMNWAQQGNEVVLPTP